MVLYRTTVTCFNIVLTKVNKSREAKLVFLTIFANLLKQKEITTNKI